MATDKIKAQAAKPTGAKPKRYPKTGAGKPVNWKTPNGRK